MHALRPREGVPPAAGPTLLHRETQRNFRNPLDPPPMPPARIPPGSSRLLRLVAGAALLVASGCGDTKPQTAPPVEAPPVPVTLGTVVAGRLERRVRAFGSFVADDEVVIAAEVPGRVVEIGPELGDRIEPKRMLARLDSEDARLALEQRRAALFQSLTRLGLEALPEREPEFERLPAVEKATLEAANAKSRLERARALHERTPPLVSDQDFADLKTAFEVAESGRRAAVLAAKTDLAEARTRAADIALAEERVRDATHVAPPGAGIWLVAERNVAVGDYVTVGAPLYRLVDADPLKLRVRVPERRMTGVVVGLDVDVADNGKLRPAAGRVTRLRPEVDPRTRTSEVEIEVPNPDFARSPGGFAIAEIKVGEDEGVPLVPAAAVTTFAGVKKVFVPDGDKAKEVLVVIGRRKDDHFEVTSGLPLGARVIVSPPPGLVNGRRIRIEPAAEGGAPK